MQQVIVVVRQLVDLSYTVLVLLVFMLRRSFWLLTGVCGSKGVQKGRVIGSVCSSVCRVRTTHYCHCSLLCSFIAQQVPVQHPVLLVIRNQILQNYLSQSFIPEQDFSSVVIFVTGLPFTTCHHVAVPCDEFPRKDCLLYTSDAADE